jgi:hypothetical protein
VASRTPGLGFVTMFDDMLDATLSTRPGFFYDGRHLKQHYLPRAFELIRAEFAAMGLRRAIQALEPAWPDREELRLENVACGVTYKVSSEWNGNYPVPFDEAPRHNYYFHTEQEPAPFILFDLRLAYMISHVRAVNRLEACRERARSLRATVSLDGRRYRELQRLEPVGDSDAEFTFATDERLVRYVKLYLAETQHFHLRHVEIMAYVFDSARH